MTRTRLAIALALLLIPASARSEAAGETAAARWLDGLVVVASRRPQPTAEAIGNFSVLDRQTVDRLQAQDIRDLVRYEPGVQVTADAARFGLDGFNIRGVQGNRVAVRIDGVPLPDGFAVGSFSNAGRDQLDPELLETVEILRGPASALYGSDALGGIVSIATRDPGDLTAGNGSGGRARMSLASRDRSRRASVIAALQGATHGVLLGHAERRGHELDNRPLGAPDSNPADIDRSTSIGKWTIDGESARLKFALERFEANVDTDVRTLVNGSGQFATTERLLADDAERRERASAQLTFDDLWQLDELQLLAFWQGSQTLQNTLQQRRAAPPAARFPTLRERQFDLEQWQQGVEAIAREQTQWGGKTQQWVFGIEVFRTRIKEQRDGREINLSTGAATNVILGERLPVRDFPNSRLRSVGAFAAAEIPLWESDWVLLPGLRFDRFAVDPTADALFVEDNPGRSVVASSDQRLTPKLGLRFDVSDRQSLYAMVAEGFRAPPFSDVNIALVLPSFNYVVLPNPDLKPERSRGVELGWSGSSDALDWRLAAFHNRYDNLIESRVNLGSNASGATVFQSVNRTRARIFGLEASTELALSRWDARLAPYSLRMALAHARGDDRSRRQPLNTVQPDRLLVELQRSAQPGWPQIALSATAVRRVSRIDRSSADLFAPPGHVLWDLRLGKALAEHWRIDLAIYNLGDKRYWDYASLRSVTRQNLPDPSYYTGPGRSAALTVGWAW